MNPYRIDARPSYRSRHRYLDLWLGVVVDNTAARDAWLDAILFEVRFQ